MFSWTWLDAMIRVGQVNGAFGVDGAVKVFPLTDFEDRFATGSTLYLDGVAREVEWARRRPAGLVVKLAGIDNRTLAELERGRYLEVGDTDARALPEDSYYHHQLVGLAVVSESGVEVGNITDVLQRPANDVWVASGDGVEQLIPATREAVLNVDLEAGRVVVADWVLEVEEV